jgi:hypothetical protein
MNRLVWLERFRNVNDAIAREKKLKGWRRSRKIRLIEQTNPRWLDLSDDWNSNQSFITSMGDGRSAMRLFSCGIPMGRIGPKLIRDSSLRSE